jgi:hypothetical protein
LPASTSFSRRRAGGGEISDRHSRFDDDHDPLHGSPALARILSTDPLSYEERTVIEQRRVRTGRRTKGAVRCDSSAAGAASDPFVRQKFNEMGLGLLDEPHSPAVPSLGGGGGGDGCEGGGTLHGNHDNGYEHPHLSQRHHGHEATHRGGGGGGGGGEGHVHERRHQPLPETVQRHVRHAAERGAGTVDIDLRLNGGLRRSVHNHKRNMTMPRYVYII